MFTVGHLPYPRVRADTRLGPWCILVFKASGFLAQGGVRVLLQSDLPAGSGKQTVVFGNHIRLKVPLWILEKESPGERQPGLTIGTRCCGKEPDSFEGRLILFHGSPKLSIELSEFLNEPRPQLFPSIEDGGRRPHVGVFFT